jgi:protoheme IX farnesyltransferase
MAANKTTFMLQVKRYYWLAKPGIVYGNLVTAIAGYFFGAAGHPTLTKLLAVIFGVAFVIGCGCVLNNIIDIPLDTLMKRTKTRALVSKKISTRAAYIYAVALGLAGFYILAQFTNALTVYTGAVGLVFYVLVYGYAKRRSVHSTLVGTVSGATPLVAGYVAATNRLDLAALLLFLVMLCWQMAHFYAIAIRHVKDYKAAGIPVLPVKKGTEATEQQIIFYIIGFMIASLFLSGFGYVGIIYSTVMVLVSVRWLQLAFRGYANEDPQKWAKRVFLFSLVSLLVFNFMIAIDHFLPL